MEKQSITHDTTFQEFCALAANNDNVFKTFKTNPTFTEVLEHCTKEQGEQYLKLVKSFFSEKFLISCSTCDGIGSGIRHNYDSLFISPNTLRYIKVLYDILNFKLINGLKNLNIVEIGAGYGGQCKVIYEQFSNIIKSYTIVDLPEVCSLSKRYLESCIPNNNVVFIDGTNIDKKKVLKKYDLFISNYAISECSSEVQKNYINTFVKKSNAGYVTYNNISNHFGISSLSMKDFVEYSGITAEYADEYPLTHPDNKIIHWKK